ncbi:MAG: hypothetical protein HY936_07145 [Nitrosomonadales bacterium]|nr:hypothetical protein [Nitrosomonadales bacterium]
MKFFKTDFPLIRRSVLMACASALSGITVLYGSSQYAEHAQESRHNAQRLLNEAQNRLAATRQDQENMLVYSGEYGALEEHKIIGDEQRLDWVEGFEKLRQQNLVTDFRYNIAPQKNYAAIPVANSGNFHVRYSEMKLHFDLLHEAQLLNFFDALRSQVKGRYQLESCTLQRGTADSNNSSRLKAECSGGWITLKNRSTPQ